MAWALYILRCADGTLYVGSTTDIDRRIAEHRSGQGGAYTRSRLPVRVVYREAHPDRSAAQRREAEIKAWPRASKLAFVRAARTQRAMARA